MNTPHDPTAQTSAATMLVARHLLRLRRRMAPPSSRRERVLRWLYLPVIQALQRREVRSIANGPPDATVVPMRMLRARARAWPARPRILVLKLDHLGDFVVGLPALATLRRAFPTAEITMVCATWNRTWATQCGLFDRVVPFDFFAPTKAEWQGVPPTHLARFQALELGAFDLAIDLRHDPDTRPLLASVSADVRVGFTAPAAQGGSSLDISLPDMEHVSVARGEGRPLHAETRLALLVAAVTETFAPAPHPMARMLPAGPSPHAPESPYLILAPGAGSPIRVWPIERLAAAGRTLAAREGLDVVLIGGPGQVADCAQIAVLLADLHVHDLSGKVPIADLPAVIAGARMMIGYDTGTSHLAAALDVPLVTVNGAIGNAEVWQTSGSRAIALTTRIACASCYLSQPSECPFEVRCMQVITPAHVEAAAEEVLSETAEPVAHEVR